MPRLNKDASLNVRMTREQRRRIDRAARLASIERGEIVEPSALFRDCGMAGVDGILARLEQQAA